MNPDHAGEAPPHPTAHPTAHPATEPSGSLPPGLHRRLPPLGALRVFSVAAHTGSFTRAAEALCVTQGAVSRQVQQLEEFYGQPLFLRQARGLVLTEAGQLLARSAGEAFERIAQTSRLLRQRSQTRELRFMLPTCAMLWAMPLLMRLQAQHPGMRLAVSTTLSHALDAERFDAGIVYAPLEATRPDRRLLFAERLTPVCSPRLLQAHGAQALHQPADLARAVLLHARPDHQDWRLWLEQAGLDAVDPAAGLDFQTLDLSNSAAAEGYGVALGDTTTAQPALASGRLCAPFGLAVATGHGFFLQWAEGHAGSPDLLRLGEALSAAAAATHPATHPAATAEPAPSAPRATAPRSLGLRR